MRALVAAVLLAASVAAEEITVSWVAPDVACRGQVVIGDREIPFSTSAPLTIDVQPSARLVFRADGCWIAPVEAAGGGVEARVWPAATLRGTLSVPPRETLPDALSIRISIAGTATTSGCTVEQNAWRCAVPSTPIDVRLGAENTAWAPHYFRGIHPKGEVDVGEIALRAGASLVGSVEMVRGAAIELLPETIATVEAKRGEDDAVRVQPSPDGFFQFTGIAPGTYEVRATAPERSPARVRSIVIGEPREYVVASTLRLEPVTPLRVQITPPADAMQRPWTVALERIHGTVAEPLRQTPADVTGWWESDPVASGLYRLDVRDASGASVHGERLEITAATGVVDVRLNLIPIRGSVTVGLKPFPSKLMFRQTGGKSVDIETDGDGRYTGLLPGTGEWKVRVMSPDRRFYLLKNDLDVQLRDEQTVAVVDITLPGGRIRGTVVDRRGDPVTGDVVVYRSQKPEADAATDAEGRFELLGIELGPVALQAVTRGAESGLVPYDVSENASAEARLVVGRKQKVEGWLATPDGHPVAGALLRYVGPTIVGIQETSTGPSGQFRFEVPAETTVLTIATLAPGMPIRLQTIDVSREGEIRLLAATSSARLFLHGKPSSMPMLVAPGSVPFPFRALIFPPDGSGRPPRGLHPEGLAIDLEPSAYRVCRQDLSRCVPAELGARTTITINLEDLR